MHNLSACIGYLWLVCALILYVCFGRLKPQFVLSLKKSVHQESEGRGGGVGCCHNFLFNCINNTGTGLASSFV